VLQTQAKLKIDIVDIGNILQPEQLDSYQVIGVGEKVYVKD